MKPPVTADQKEALLKIAHAFPAWVHERTRWTAASSLIRKGLVRKRPADAFSEGRVRPVNGAEYALTSKGVGVIRTLDQDLYEKIEAIVKQLVGP